MALSEVVGGEVELLERLSRSEDSVAVQNSAARNYDLPYDCAVVKQGSSCSRNTSYHSS